MTEAVKDNSSQAVSGNVPPNQTTTKESGSKPLTKTTDKIREDQLIYLPPEEVLFPDELDVRPWSKLIGPTELEIEEIDKLAKTIDEEGQIDPIKVRVNPEGKYEALTGSRRVQAILQINAGKGKNEKPLRVKAIVSDEPIKQAHAFRQAAISNIQRKSLSPMDFAACIKTVKENVKGFATPKTLAEYFAVSPATISQHLKLLELPNDIQMRVHKGELSNDAAFALVNVKPEKRAEVLAKGAEIQQAEAAKTDTPQTITPVAQGTQPPPKKAPRKTKTVKARHVKEAARETPGAEAKPQARSRKEIVDFFVDNQGPAYGYPNGSIHKFLAAFVKWAHGELSDRTLDKYFSEMVVKADRGKPEPKEKDSPKK